MPVIKKSFLLVCATLIASLPISTSFKNVSALSETVLDEYAQNNILFYDPDENCSDGSSGGGVAGLAPGSNVEQKMWNYFVRAGIEGISNDPKVIAGILGNFAVESGYNPFLYSGSYRGLHMLYNDYGGSDLKSAVDEAVGKDLWMNYYDDDVMSKNFSDVDGLLADKGITEQQIDAALTTSLDFYFKGEANGKPLASSTALGTKGYVDSFIGDLGKVANKTPTAYAELFLVWVERAVHGESPITDSGVIPIAIEQGEGDTYYQGTAQRAAAAEEVYNRLAGTTVPTTTASSGSLTDGGTNVAAASSGGYKKYDDLTDAELWDLAELAMAENGGTMTAFKNTLSITANLFEKNGDGNNGHSLWLYARDGGWFAGGTSAQINGQKDRSDIETKHIDAAREVLMTGNRTLPTQILEFDCVGDLDWVELDGKKYTASNPGNCGGTGLNEENYYVAGKTKIHNVYGAEYIFYGWMGGEFGNGDPMGYFADNPPTDTAATTDSGSGNNTCLTDSKKSSVAGGTQIAKAAVSMAWPVQADQNDDEHVGKCKDSDGSWKPYSTANYPNTCATNPRDLYRQQLDTWLPGDNGMDCGKYVTTVLRYAKAADTTASADLENYFKGDSNWEKLSDPSTSNLKPGDVFFQPHHVAIYIGDYGGTYGPIASASLDERVGQVTPYYNESSTTSAWRYKGSVGEGLTPEQAEKLAENYNNNVGNWDGKVAQEGNYCQGSGCASRYSNCTLFSAFFAEMFTDIGFGHGWPDGINVVDTLKEMGFETGREPKPFAIFSTSTYHTPSGNHTGVVVGVDGNSIATVEAGYPSLIGTYFDYTDVSGEDIWYAYLDSKLDYNKLMDYINK